MVATIEVLSGTAGDVAAYFTASAGSEYYAAERTGQWFGESAKLLGLKGEVKRSDFERLLAGFSPSGQRLVRRMTPTPDKKPALAYDTTLSLPKSVSALWAVSSDKVRRDIEDAAAVAGRKTLSTFEQSIPLARRGRGGARFEQAAVVGAAFLHTVNRENEPQLHLHNVWMNLCRGSDGRWSAVNSRLLHKWTPTLGRVFRCNLAAELKERLGVDLYRPTTKDGRPESWFEITGVPSKLISFWSSRRSAILKEVDGTQHKLGRSAAKAREVANRKTRKKKTKTPEPTDRREQWIAEAKRHGFDEQRAKELLGQPRQTPAKGVYAEALDKAIQELTTTEAHFTAREVVQHVCESVQHLGLDGSELMNRVLSDLDQSQQLVELQEVAGERQYTTREMWAIEENLLSDVQELTARPGAIVPDSVAERVVSLRGSLEAEQGSAAQRLMTQGQAIRVLSGVAGSGKSYTLDAVRQGFELAGYEVRGAALSGAAKEELVRQTKIESRTVASYLYHLDKPLGVAVSERVKHDVKQLTRAALKKKTFSPTKVKLHSKSVLIIDEAAMLDTRSLQRIVHHVKRARATLILAGDVKQLPPILAGGPMESVVMKTGDAKLKQNRRQRDPADRQAVADLRRGEITRALKNYTQRGRITIGKDRSEAVDKLVDMWRRNGGASRPADHMIFTQTRAEAQLVNSLCQRERLQSLRSAPRRSLKFGEERIHVGERVLFHKACRSQGIENGYRGTVVSVDVVRRRMKVRLDQKTSARGKGQAASSLVTVSARELGAEGVTLGYSATTHKLQGQTVKHAYLLLGGAMTSREMAYVQATRAQESTHIFVDKLHAGEELQDLAASIDRSRKKKLAHDIGVRPQKQSHELTLSQQRC